MRLGFLDEMDEKLRSANFYQGCIWFFFRSVYGWTDTARSINRVSQSSRTRGRFAGVNRPTAVYTVLVFLFFFWL